MKSINIAIADDHQLFREGLSFILSSSKKYNILFEAENGMELLHKMNSKKLPEVILMDLKMPIMDGIEATEKIKAQYPDVKIIILTMHHEESVILHLLDLGANGYLLKNSSSQEVANAIDQVVTKDYYFTEYITSVMLKGIRKQIKPAVVQEGDFQLTKREIEVLTLICSELTTGEIAERLCISERTVETHRKSLLEKLNAKNTAGLVIKAMKANVIEF
ncbi:MAG TPA: response regulator transcription factor [Cytophagales bacterium]|nr:response regulator transcription factor [Cytophagales bacterium]